MSEAPSGDAPQIKIDLPISIDLFDGVLCTSRQPYAYYRVKRRRTYVEVVKGAWIQVGHEDVQ
jgi:hypothetical protein